MNISKIITAFLFISVAFMSSLLANEEAGWTDPETGITWTYLGQGNFANASQQCGNIGQSLPQVPTLSANNPVTKSLSTLLRISPIAQQIPYYSIPNNEKAVWTDNTTLITMHNEIWYHSCSYPGRPPECLDLPNPDNVASVSYVDFLHNEYGNAPTFNYRFYSIVCQSND